MVCEGPSFWRTMNRNIEEKRDIDASKGSEDDGSKANKPGLTGCQALLTRLASEPIKSRDWLLVRGKAVLKIAYSRKTYLKAHYQKCRLLAYEFLDLVITSSAVLARVLTC